MATGSPFPLRQHPTSPNLIMSKAGDHGHGGSEKDWEARVTRFEVIDETGRAYVRDHRRDPVQVELSYQDDGRTLKVFVRSRKA